MIMGKPPWLQEPPIEKPIVFKDSAGRELTLMAMEDGDDAVIYLHDKDVTSEMKAILGRDWYSEVRMSVTRT